MSTRERRIGELFHLVVDLDADERGRILDEECGADHALRTEVEDLLAHDDPAFLEPPEVGDVRPEPGDRIGKYEIVRRLGEGAMGEVFLARRGAPFARGEVAIKVLNASAVAGVARLGFVQELRALGVLNHDGIARVFDADETEDGAPYFVMEYVDGVWITDFCRVHRLGVRARLELFLQVCAAVQHAHTKGVIHRDLKPSNILVTGTPERPVAKIIDFGIAKALSRDSDGSVQDLAEGAGTPEYMGPEQTGPAGNVDTRADIYALGATLYELLAGVVPIPMGRGSKVTVVDWVDAIRHAQAPRPSARVASGGPRVEACVTSCGLARRTQLQRALSGDLDRIVETALAKDPDDRFQSADEFARNIACHLAGRPVPVVPWSARYLTRKFVARHARSLTLVAGGTMLLVLAGFLWLRLSEHVRERAVRRDHGRFVEAYARLPAFWTLEHDPRLADREFPEPVAADELALALAPDGERAWIRWLLFHAHAQAGDIARARDDACRLPARDTPIVDAVVSGVLDERSSPAVPSPAELLGAGAPGSAFEHAVVAYAALRWRDGPVAFEHATHATEMRPDVWTYNALRAAAALMCGDCDAALGEAAAVERALGRPTCRTWFAKARFWTSKEHAEEASRAYERCLELEPRQWQALHNLAWLKLSDDADAAEELLLRARALRDSFRDHAALAEVRRVRRDHEGALDALRAARARPLSEAERAALDRQWIRVLTDQALYLHEHGDATASRSVLERALHEVRRTVASLAHEPAVRAELCALEALFEHDLGSCSSDEAVGRMQRCFDDYLESESAVSPLIATNLGMLMARVDYPDRDRTRRMLRLGGSDPLTRERVRRFVEAMESQAEGDEKYD